MTLCLLEENLSCILILPGNIPEHVENSKSVPSATSVMQCSHDSVSTANSHLINDATVSYNMRYEAGTETVLIASAGTRRHHVCP